MVGLIHYLNTDLDLSSAVDITELTNAFECGGVSPLHVTLGADGLWYSSLETDHQYHEPEGNIAHMVSVIEQLAEPHLSVWRSCTLCEFNIGYDCGLEPWAFNQGLSHELLARIAAVGASLRVTLYPYRVEVDD